MRQFKRVSGAGCAGWRVGGELIPESCHPQPLNLARRQIDFTTLEFVWTLQSRLDEVIMGRRHAQFPHSGQSGRTVKASGWRLPADRPAVQKTSCAVGVPSGRQRPAATRAFDPSRFSVLLRLPCVSGCRLQRFKVKLIMFLVYYFHLETFCG